MKVPLAVPNLGGREAEYLQECVRSTFVSTAGPFVRRFEEQIADLTGTETASAMCSGTVALQMALEGLGVGCGDLVLLPSLTFIASANAIRHTGALPWLVDCTAADWTVDLDLARDVLETETDDDGGVRVHRASGRRVRAIMPVMVMGASLDFPRISEFAERYQLKVVVDAAAAIGATGPSDEPLGRTGAHAICYSFNGNKTVTSGGGGAVASADAGLIERIAHLISTGRVGTEYEHDVVAYNFRMTNIEAAVGVAQLEQLDRFLDRKRAVSERYARLASEFPDLAAFPSPPRGNNTHWFSGFAYMGPDVGVCDRFRRHMTDRDVDVRPFWKPIHLQRPYADVPATKMPVTDDLWGRIVPLPCSTGITEDELDYVVASAREFWGAIAEHADE